MTRLYEQGSIHHASDRGLRETLEEMGDQWARRLGVWATRRRVFDYALSEPSRTGLEINRRLRRR
ncbi:hypothetical protein OAA19_02655 [Rubripirellula sp.]|nr:hypothetical protein [Rubripirellula sp.]MDB4338990.1 hypothetical protein [Rubripirellula sp.]